MDPESFVHVRATMYPLYAHQVSSEWVLFWLSYCGKSVVDGDLHVKFKCPPNPHSGSDPDENWSVDRYCHPICVYQI